MDEKKVIEAIAKEKETIKTLEDAVVSGKTGSLRRWAKDTIENSTIIIGALEKQIPKKPVHIGGDGIRYTDLYRCPNCGQGFTGTGIADYCYHCGQKLDWSE